MRQVARRLKDGSLEVVDVAEPSAPPGHVLVEVAASVISAGTERATLEAAEKNLLAKARARPDQARQVIDRVRREGTKATIDFVRQRLDELGPLGYSAAGRITEVGEEVTGIAPGDRVAIAGAGLANHAELDIVPQLLCARIPDGVADEDAAFATIGAIAMHGFRRAEVEVGSTVVVIGLGLVGQLATQIALAAGCTVLGVDLDPRLIELAEAAGARAWTRDDADAILESSADAVLICASAASDDPVHFAAKVAKDRAPVVVVGDVKMNVPRGPFFKKELDLRLSRSYGPGRYDPGYELHGRDYPEGYVRWTERRNLVAFLDLIASGRIDPSVLVTHRFEIAAAQQAYEVLKEERPIAIVLGYPPRGSRAAAPAASRTAVARPTGKPRFGLIGAGSFATGKIIPGLVGAGMVPARVSSGSGLSAESARQRFGFEAAAAGPEAVLDAGDIDLVVVATPHNLHASLVAEALRRDIAVYVEKPLALDWEGLALVREALAATQAPLFVGFNRRYAPAAAQLRALAGPRLMAYRVNAGRLAADHWTNDLEVGGGRLKGEGCHFIDFLCDQAGADPVTVSAAGFPSSPALARGATDNFSLQIRFADGSVGTVNYAADAPTGPGKEHFETSSPDAYGVIDDFRGGAIWRGSSRTSIGSRRQDKGFDAQFALIGDVLAGKHPAPPAERYLLSTMATLAAARSLETGLPETIVEPAGEPAAEPVTR